jgi:hypothetical protein
MEYEHEEKAAAQEESARSGAGPVGRVGAQRGQKARQQGEWTQGRLGQKPQENPGSAAQCTAAAAWASQVVINNIIERIRARYGVLAIGRGIHGIRYRASH